MIDVSGKYKTLRTATAEATLKLNAATLQRVRNNDTPKADPLAVARVAAVQAAKNTSQIIPYCHPLPIDHVGITFALGEAEIVITATVKAIHKTGVEMEALSAAAVAALTLYDMLKMLDEQMEISGIKLISKKGGKHDFREKFPTPLRGAVLVMSDSIAQGKKDDLSGRLIVERLQAEGVVIEDYKIIPDDALQIASVLGNYADNMKLDLVLTTGGTGLGLRDCTPEAVSKVFEREIPGIAEAMRAYGQERTPYAMLSRSRAGVRGQTVIVNLPGSKRGVAESLDAILPGLFHVFHMMRGESHPEHNDGRERQA